VGPWARPLLLEQQWGRKPQKRFSATLARPKGCQEPQAKRASVLACVARQCPGSERAGSPPLAGLLLRLPPGGTRLRAKVRLGQGETSLLLATVNQPRPLEPLKLANRLQKKVLGGGG